MIFVTLGSQKFQFNRLLKKIDELIEKKVIKETVFAQIGASDYKPRFFKYVDFLDRAAFAKAEEESQIMITHGGTGAIIGAVKKGIKVIAVPRLAQYGEHVDDHQIQLLEQFDGMGIIQACYNLNDLEACYLSVQTASFQSYKSSTNEIIESIEAYLSEM